jgi:CheY-like chemotaxis protein
VLIAVTDNGAGMAPDVLEKAFEPFFTTKAKGAGTGLGLSQVHGFIKQSGGHVKIYSEPGAGTTVKLYLPRHEGAVEEESSAPRRNAASLGCKVLVAEDDAGVRSFAREALHDLGCEVIEAENGAEALRKIEQGAEFSVLLTDIVMPGMSGRELADRVAKLRPDTKIIYMTGFTQNAVVHNGVLDAGTRLLSKPFTLAQLDMELNAALAPAKDAAETG